MTSTRRERRIQSLVYKLELVAADRIITVAVQPVAKTIWFSIFWKMERLWPTSKRYMQKRLRVAWVVSAEWRTTFRITLSPFLQKQVWSKNSWYDYKIDYVSWMNEWMSDANLPLFSFVYFNHMLYLKYNIVSLLQLCTFNNYRCSHIDHGSCHADRVFVLLPERKRSW